MTWRETLETALARGTAGQLAPAIRDALAFIDARDGALTWPGVASAPGTSDRIEAEVKRRWPQHADLHRLVGRNTDALIEFAVHITISMLQQDPAVAPTEDQTDVPRGNDQGERADSTADRPMPAGWVLDPVTEGEIRALGLDVGPVQ